MLINTKQVTMERLTIAIYFIVSNTKLVKGNKPNMS